MNVLVLSQYYPPDLGAVSFRMEAIVKELRANGHRVYVLAATPNRYKDYKIDSKLISKTDEIRIEMINNSQSIISRIKGFFEFYLKSIKKKKYYKNKKIDIVISTTPYVLEGLAGQRIAKYLNAKHLLDVRDLWPDTPIALGKIKKNGIIAYALKIVEKKLYKKTDHIIITSPGYEQHIKSIVIKKPIDLILNGIDEEFEDEFNKYSTRNNIKKSSKVKTILYAGNIGVAQNLTTFIEAANDLKEDNIRFQLIGSGTQLKEIKELIKYFELENIDIISPVKREELFKYYFSADILYLQLFSSEYFNKVVPSKIFEYLLIPKPIIYGLDGVSAEILKKYDETYYVVPDDSNDLVKTIKKIDFSKVISRDIKSLRRNIQIKKYLKIIEEIVEEKK
jgi:glycosyltransferase involved in cell wall biosynthesis